MNVVLGFPVDKAKRQALEREFGTKLPIYAKSVVENCVGCGEAVWIGPRSRVLVDARQALVVCPQCLPSYPPDSIVSLGNNDDLNKEK